EADADFDVVVVVDSTGKRWSVRAPRRAAAGAAIEAELGLLERLAAARERGELGFAVPRAAGSAPLPDGGHAVVFELIRGTRLSLAALGPGPGLTAALGRAIASVHELPVGVVEEAGLPVYTAEEYRKRRLAELDVAVQTGKVPPTL